MTKLTNILFLNHTSIVSGAEISLLNCLEKMDKTRHRQILVCPPTGPLLRRARDLGITTRTLSIGEISFTRNPVRFSLALFSVFKGACLLIPTIRKHDIDIIHANSIRAGLIGSIAANLTGTPIVWHIRDFLPQTLVGKIVRLLSCYQATKIIAVSEAVRKDFATFKRQQEKTVVVYDGVNNEQFDAATADLNLAREEWSLEEAYPVVGIIGHLIDRKGQKEFIEAAATVAKRYPKARFLIVGEALFRKTQTLRYKKQLVDLTRALGISDRVAFAGFRDDVRNALAVLDILVLASWKEPLGMVLLEAMAMGKPVIATRAGGAVEVVADGKTGILVPPRDAGCLADAIIKLSNDQNRMSKMGDDGRKRVAQYFSLELHVRKIQLLYQETLAFKQHGRIRQRGVRKEIEARDSS